MKPRRVTLLGLSPALPFTLYWWQLRRHAAQELLAAAGIAVGVALVFGVLVANSSISGSVKGLVHQLIGSAQLQLAARSEQGFSERIVARVEATPGVEATSPLLRENVTLVNERGNRDAVQLVGVTARQFLLNPVATRDLGTSAESLVAGGMALPQSVAEALDISPDDSVIVKANGKARKIRVSAVLGSEAVGTVASSPIAISSLYTAQQLTGESGRVTNVLIKAAPGKEAVVRRGLGYIGGSRIDVSSADNDVSMFAIAASPNQQSTTLFAGIAGMVGFLLAFNSMLLTVSERRRLVAELRTYGYDATQILFLIGIQTLCLGVIGSLIGLVLGDIVAHTLFAQVPTYLTAAFPIGATRTITTSSVVLAFLCGLVAAALASVRPLFDLRHPMPGLPMQGRGEAGEAIRQPVMTTFAVLGCVLVAGATIIAVLSTTLAVMGGILLAVAVVCVIPVTHAGVVRALRPLSERSKSVFAMAVMELEGAATRAVAVSAIAGLAVYGTIAVGGAGNDLRRGIDTAISEYERTADVWITTGANVFNTDSFHRSQIYKRVARVPGVTSVTAYRGSLLDVGGRRLWVRARSAQTRQSFEPSQVIHGNYTTASQLVRAGGWAAISSAVASERHLAVGQSFLLPTPTGIARLGVAAITTNSGWPAGTITVSGPYYERLWGTGDPSALEVHLAPGVNAATAQRSIEVALGGGSGLSVQTATGREAQTDGVVGQGLKGLSEISRLLWITGSLAVAASLAAAMWRRRSRMAAMKTWGYDHVQLWRSLLLETTVLLSTGCITGAVLGVYGHALADRWLRATTGFPAPFSTDGTQALFALAVVVGATLLAIAVPGLAAARVSPTASFQE